MLRDISIYIIAAMSLFSLRSFSNSNVSDENLLPVLSESSLKSLPPADQEIVRSFFGQTMEKLPKSLFLEIHHPIEVRFDLPARGDLRFPFCEGPAGNSGRDQFEGKSSEAMYKDFVIHIDARFIGVILQGEEKAATYSCGHRNMYRYVQGLLVRQIARLYDSLNIFPHANIKERHLLMQCVFASGPVSVQQVDERCRELQTWAHSVSDRPVWRNLRHLQSQNNFEILADDFARHLEFYILDPEFPCRKPAVNEFLNRYFDVRTPITCKLNTKVPIDMASEQLDLDYQRLYEVHVLLADPGSNMESRWGHVMFRLVMCSPERNRVGPECLEDVDSHIVVGFLGAPGTILTSNWDGLRGKYPSILSVQSFGVALNQYTIQESRSLTSIPLKLSANEKKLFVYRALEDIWAYRGRYLFLTNNCATEARHFLQGVLQAHDESILQRQGLIETSMKLFNFLIEQGYADHDVLADKSKKASYIFTSPRKKWNDDAGAELMVYLESFSAEERRHLYEQKKLSQPQHAHGIAVDFYEAELEIYAHLKAEKDRVLQSFVVEDQKNLRGEYIDLVNQLQTKLASMSLQNLVASGYGVPLIYEMKPENEIKKISEEIHETTAKLEILLRRDRPDIFSDLKESNNNMKYFFKDMKTNN